MQWQGAAAAIHFYLAAKHHTGRPRPEDGYPYRASYVADNDLALANCATVFPQPVLEDMAIFVTEDDAQDGATTWTRTAAC